MAKKPKETSAENPNSSTSSSSDDIFKSLYDGITPDDPISVSIFLNSDPFSKKHIDDSRSIPEKLKQVLRLDAHGPQKFDTQIAESSDKNSNKRRRNNNIPDSIHSNDSDVERSIKKSRREVGLVQESSNLDQVKKKKRKRIEIEAESVEGKYDNGGMDMDLKQVKGGNLEIGKKRKHLDSGEDLIVTEEGLDDEEKLLRTIFVENLPLKVKKKALLREFGQFGEIESIQIGSVPLLNDKTPIKGTTIKKQLNNAVDRVKINAYIVFKTEESAQASLSSHMAAEGRNPIHIEPACPPRKKLKRKKTPIYDSKSNRILSKRKEPPSDDDYNTSHKKLSIGARHQIC